MIVERASEGGVRGRPNRRRDPGGDPSPGKRRRPDSTPERDDRLYCAACGHPVTRERWRIAVNGAHEHVVFNPAGRLFRIGCFAVADGAAAVGAASDAFTWFKGFMWRIALCAGCGAHLGWRYSSGGALADFFGLILGMLSASPRKNTPP